MKSKLISLLSAVVLVSGAPLSVSFVYAVSSDSQVRNADVQVRLNADGNTN